MRDIILLSLVLAIEASVAYARPPSGSPEAFLDSLYRPLAANKDWGTIEHKERYYTPQLVRLLDQDSPAGEVGKLDAEPICNSQDTNGQVSYTIKIVSQTAKTASAIVHLKNSDARDFRFDLQKRGGAWLIADIHSREIPSLRRFLAK